MCTLDNTQQHLQCAACGAAQPESAHAGDLGGREQPALDAGDADYNGEGHPQGKRRLSGRIRMLELQARAAGRHGSESLCDGTEPTNGRSRMLELQARAAGRHGSESLCDGTVPTLGEYVGATLLAEVVPGTFRHLATGSSAPVHSSGISLPVPGTLQHLATGTPGACTALTMSDPIPTVGAEEQMYSRASKSDRSAPFLGATFDPTNRTMNNEEGDGTYSELSEHVPYGAIAERGSHVRDVPGRNEAFDDLPRTRRYTDAAAASILSDHRLGPAKKLQNGVERQFRAREWAVGPEPPPRRKSQFSNERNRQFSMAWYHGCVLVHVLCKQSAQQRPVQAQGVWC